jgi:hypothetical protein
MHPGMLIPNDTPLRGTLVQDLEALLRAQGLLCLGMMVTPPLRHLQRMLKSHLRLSSKEVGATFLLMGRTRVTLYHSPSHCNAVLLRGSLLQGYTNLLQTSGGKSYDGDPQPFHLWHLGCN